MAAKISIKVFVDKVKKRVLYAEADHSFVDILFSFMTLPMGTIIKLLKKHDADKKFDVLGSFNNLYQSLVDLPECYLATAECKFSLLNPRNASYNYCTNLKLKIDDSEPIMKHLSCPKCLKNRVYFRICYNAKCVECGGWMSSYPNYDPDVWCGGGGGGVFVSDAATYIVTDDFSVIPFTMEGCLRLLLDSGITDSSHLEERNLDMGREQILCLLKTALAVDCPFTHFVFDNVQNIQSVGHHWQDTVFYQCNSKEKEASKASTKILLEVYLQKSTGNLLFAEAKEDFVDFLFGFYQFHWEH